MLPIIRPLIHILQGTHKKKSLIIAMDNVKLSQQYSCKNNIVVLLYNIQPQVQENLGDELVSMCDEVQLQQHRARPSTGILYMYM
jgi:hypothetical protein